MIRVLECSSAHACLLVHAKSIRESVHHIAAQETLTLELAYRIVQIDNCDYDRLLDRLKEEAEDLARLRDCGVVLDRPEIFDMSSTELAELLGYKRTSDVSKIIHGKKDLPGWLGGKDKLMNLLRQERKGNKLFFSKARVMELIRLWERDKKKAKVQSKQEEQRIREAIRKTRTRREASQGDF